MINDTPHSSKISKRRLLSLAAALFAGVVLTGPAMAADKDPQVTLKTSLGDIVLELNPEKAPVTVKNFLEYVNAGFYNGTIFHRVIDGFMIQGGGFTANGEEKPTHPSIKNEGKNGLKNDNYTISMARRGDPDSATAQFFINVKDNAGLDFPNPDGHGYAVFGKVVKGKEVVDKIKASPKTNKGGAFTDAPTTPVVIESATVVK